MTLNDYATGRENVVLFYAGIGQPTGDYTVLGYPDLDFVDRAELLDLEGEIDTDGDWHWNGEGNPLDDNGNSITKLHAYVEEEKYAAIIDAYESEG